MRRVDRIISSALCNTKSNSLNSEENAKIECVNKESTCEPDLNTNFTDLTAVPNQVHPKISMLSNKDMQKDINMTDSGKDITNSPNTLLKKVLDDIESPIAPDYSPHPTPPVSKNTVCQNINSPDEPMNENSSPIRRMSPSTLDIYNTLITDLDKNNTDDETAQPENAHKELNESTNKRSFELQDYMSDFSNTDSDFIPNSDDGVSSDENTGRVKVKKLSITALVHSSRKQSTTKSLMIPESPSSEISQDEAMTNRSLAVRNENNMEFESNSNENIVSESVVYKGRPKKGRKRKNAEHTIAQKKHRKYQNLPYFTNNKKIEPKTFKDYKCSCLKICHELIPAYNRQKEFQNFISLGSYEAQLLYIVNSVKETPKVRAYTVVQGNKTGKSRPKEFKRTYKIGDTEVCKDMFLKNFQITSKKVDVSLRKKRLGKLIKDQRGSHGGWNKTADQDIDFIKDVINALPKYVSHYRRSEENCREYLKLGMTVKKIYELYVEKTKEVYGEQKKPVSFSTVKRIFYTNFDLRCKRLKKDTCNKCDTLSNKINSCGTEETLEALKNERDGHQKRAQDLRNRMNLDLMQAKNDETFECITFDLEKTLPLPRIPTSIVFYKRQLWLYNCGLHVGSSDKGYCYVWVEGEAGRGAQEVGSCLIKYIKHKLNSKVQNLVLWSDCCGGQNRNIKIVLMMKVILNSHPNLKTITLKYLESGHTFLPNDTDFSKIEANLKFHERIYTADEYIKVIENSKKKKPLTVERMERKDFLSTVKLEKKIVNRKNYVNKIKTSWLNTKEILLKKDDKYTIYMKTTLREDVQELNIEKKIKGKSIDFSEDDFTMLWPNGKEIPQAKSDDLESMFDLIPKDCLGFYKGLKGNPEFVDDIEGYGGHVDFAIEIDNDVLSDGAEIIDSE